MASTSLTLVVGGEGFEGPPKFTVSFNDKPIGEGTVAGAIDTTQSGRFIDSADQGKYVQSFDFSIPDADFRPDGVVAIKLVNEAHGAIGGKENRELFIKSVAVNGEVRTANDLAMRSAQGVEPTAVIGDYLVVSAEAVEGVAYPPDDGWKTATVASAAPTSAAPQSDTAVAAAPDVAVPPAAEPKTAASAGPAPEPATKVATVAPTPAPISERPQDVADDGLDANPDPEGNLPRCDLNKSFQVTGFNENSNDLTIKARKALDVVVHSIGAQRCVVHVTGYSSTEGDYAHNALFSIERSRNALQYLRTQGVKFRRFSANGVGETTQFGDTPGANRRVVVTVSP